MSKTRFLNSTVIGLSITAISVTAMTLSLQLGSKVELLDSQLGQQKAEIALLTANVDAVKKQLPQTAYRQSESDTQSTALSDDPHHDSPARYRNVRRENAHNTDALRTVMAQFKDSMCGLTSDVNAVGCHAIISSAK